MICQKCGFDKAQYVVQRNKTKWAGKDKQPARSDFRIVCKNKECKAEYNELGG